MVFCFVILCEVDRRRKKRTGSFEVPKLQAKQPDPTLFLLSKSDIPQVWISWGTIVRSSEMREYSGLSGILSHSSEIVDKSPPTTYTYSLILPSIARDRPHKFLLQSDNITFRCLLFFSFNDLIEFL